MNEKNIQPQARRSVRAVAALATAGALAALGIGIAQANPPGQAFGPHGAAGLPGLGLTIGHGISPGHSQARSWLSDLTHHRWPADRWIDRLVAYQLDHMSLAEKVGQMTQAELQSVTPEQAREYNLGSILNGAGSWPNNDKHASVATWVATADAFYNASKHSSTGIPLIWGIDAVHGNNNVYGATLYPHNIALGATRDPALVRQIAHATAEEVAVTGLDWAFAPTIAVARNIRWGRTYESYSQNPRLVAAYADQAVIGLQGDLRGDETVVATAKHYIGDGGTTNGNDQGNTQLDEATLLRVHGAGYRAAIAAGVQSVMVSYSSVNGQKMSANRHLITDVLKHDWGFDGLVISDYNAIGQIPGCTNSDCPAAVNAGIDLFMVPQEWQAFIANTIREVKNGQIPMSRIDDAVTRILRVKYRSGLFSAPAPSQRRYAGDTRVFGSKTHRRLARRAVHESLVLLKNDGHRLPLDRRARVLVAGAGADSFKLQAGGWTSSWQGTDNTNADFPIGETIWDGIHRLDPRARLDVSGASADPSRDDLAVVVVGERPYAEFMGDVAADSRIGAQGEDTLDFAASFPEQYATIQHIHDAGVPMVVVLLSGRPLYVNPLMNLADAFVAAWQPGTEGAGVADVLFDHGAGFTGKLSFSWPNGPCQANFLDDTSADNAPLFDYGYGLTYRDHRVIGNDLPLRTHDGACGDTNTLSAHAD